jgi:hypothetical protein
MVNPRGPRSLKESSINIIGELLTRQKHQSISVQPLLTNEPTILSMLGQLKAAQPSLLYFTYWPKVAGE